MIKTESLKLSDELINNGIKEVYYNGEQLEINFISKDGKDDTIRVNIFEHIHTTLEELDTFVNGSIDYDTYKKLRYHITRGLGPIWNKIYVPVSNYSNNYNQAEQETKKTKIQLAFETVRQEAQNLFIDEYKIPHIAITNQDHLEVFPVNSNLFKNWYRMFIFEKNGIVLDSGTISDLCSLASAYAQSAKYGSQYNLHLRTALTRNYKTEWNYDLVNKNWEFIRITSNGWDICKKEIIFRRFNNNKAQIYPDRNYEPGIFEQFMRLVNIESDDNDSKLLLQIYIIHLFIPEIQKAVLILHGSQGSAKSTLQELIKMIVDPSAINTLVFPRGIDELNQQLNHNYLAYYDNVSHLSNYISDQLCRAVTGSGSSKRMLFTDDDDVLRNFKRCISLNGINQVVTKPDLLDRSIIIKLERIEDNNQRTPAEILQEFDRIRPQLLAYILDLLVKVLAYEENNPNEKFKMKRMTEFSKYGEIISRCLGNKKDEFLNAYLRNRQLQSDEIVESSQIATVILHMMFEKYSDKEIWDGTPTALFTEIESIAQSVIELNINTGDHYWPSNVRSLGSRLNEITPTLKDKGLEVKRYQETNRQRTRKIEIRKCLSETSETSEGEKSCSNLDKTSDDLTDKPNNPSNSLSENNDKNHAQNTNFGQRTTSDKDLHILMGKEQKSCHEGNGAYQ